MVIQSNPAIFLEHWEFIPKPQETQVQSPNCHPAILPTDRLKLFSEDFPAINPFYNRFLRIFKNNSLLAFLSVENLGNALFLFLI